MFAFRHIGLNRLETNGANHVIVGATIPDLVNNYVEETGQDISAVEGKPRTYYYMAFSQQADADIPVELTAETYSYHTGESIEAFQKAVSSLIRQITVGFNAIYVTDSDCLITVYRGDIRQAAARIEISIRFEYDNPEPWVKVFLCSPALSDEFRQDGSMPVMDDLIVLHQIMQQFMVACSSANIHYVPLATPTDTRHRTPNTQQ